MKFFKVFDVKKAVIESIKKPLQKIFLTNQNKFQLSYWCFFKEKTLLSSIKINFKKILKELFNFRFKKKLKNER